MKVCFPVEVDNGLDSIVYDHFGQAGDFVIVDSESMQVVSIDNPKEDSHDGQCGPVARQGSTRIDALVVGGIGRGAIMRFQAMGTRIYRSTGGTIRENLEMLTSGRLEEYPEDATCPGHGHH